MHKEVLFQPWAVWYPHNHPDKMVGNAKPLYYCSASHMLLTSRASTSENTKHSGDMTNNQFSSLHTHSETVTVPQGG